MPVKCQYCNQFDGELSDFAKTKLSLLGALHVPLSFMYDEYPPPLYGFNTEEWMQIRTLLAIAAHQFPCEGCATAKQTIRSILSKLKLFVSARGRVATGQRQGSGKARQSYGLGMARARQEQGSVKGRRRAGAG